MIKEPTPLIAFILMLINIHSIAQTYPTPASYYQNYPPLEIFGQAHGSFFNDGEDLEPGLLFNYKSLIFHANLWFGGKDANGQIHGSFQNYAQWGYDNFGGPVADVYDEETVFNQWNQSYYITLDEVENHMQNWDNVGYNIPASLLNWPAHGNTDLGEADQLAPFRDLNNNNRYEPQFGEYPEFPGEYCVLTLFNDNRPHEESFCQVVKAEVYQYLYWFDRTIHPELANIVFSKHHLINRSSESYSDFRVGLFVDADLGNYQDDFIGSDPEYNLCYFYNGDAEDETLSGFGLYPPAVGITQLNSNLSGVIGDIFNVPSAITSLSCNQYYNALGRVWHDGVHLKEGGIGWPVGEDADFIYNDQNNWSEIQVSFDAGDRKGILCSDIGDLGPSEEICLDYAFIAVQITGSTLVLIDSLKSKVSETRSHPDVEALTSNCTVTLSTNSKLSNKPNIQIFPNPSNDWFQFRSSSNIDYTVYDIHGRLIHSFSCEDSCSWDASNLPSGIFIVVGKTPDGVVSTRRITKY